MKENVRMGIIGLGNMGSVHARNILQGLVPNMILTAVCDHDLKNLYREDVPLSENVQCFEHTADFFRCKEMDAVLIATPHYDHPKLAIQAFEAGYHVLIEKPAGVYTSQVREMNIVAENSNKVFGIMYNQRTNPIYKKVRQMVQDGTLGSIKRMVWIITNWYRSQSYYDSGGWRATWAGEGGGVLLNQDPHQLDLLQWICGMPNGIRAFMQYGAHRNIEVENDVTAYLTFPNGATGVFITSTHETPGTNRLEISGDQGKIVVENDKLTFWRTEVKESEWNQTYMGGFGEPGCWECIIPIQGGGGEQHVGILKDFTKGILEGTPLLAPGKEGIQGLSISNAMHLSAWTDTMIDPSHIDEALFYERLKEKIKNTNADKGRSNER